MANKPRRYSERLEMTLSEDQKARLERLAEIECTSVAALVRRGISKVLREYRDSGTAPAFRHSEAA